MKLILFLTIVAGYRYGLASEIIQGDYKTLVLSKLNLVFRNEHFNLQYDLAQAYLEGCKVRYNNPEFRTLVAALDMFWCKFPDFSTSKLRVYTLNARFKDCSSISELNHLSRVSSLKIGEILKLAFSVRVRDEVLGIGRPGEEFSQPVFEAFYFPYMRELHLSKKSPYSSTQNVELHN